MSYVQEPQELKDLIDTTKLVQKFLPKQMDIDKILDIIKRNVLKATHLDLTIKEIQAIYLSSPYFKDLYLFLSQNKLPSKRLSIKKVKTLVESFVLLDSLIFKLVMMPDKEVAVLAIPEICIDKIIALYHTSVFTGHQGVVKTYLTTRVKVMPKTQKGHKFILCIIDKMTNYMITVPIHHSRSEEVGEALIEHVISKFCAPNCIIMDSAFMSTLTNYLFRKLNIKIMTIAPYSHQSLQAKHGIK